MAFHDSQRKSDSATDLVSVETTFDNKLNGMATKRAAPP